MVFQSLVRLARGKPKGPDEFWRKRKIFRLSAHFRGRARNCYSNSIRAVHRSLQYATKSRDPKKALVKEVWVSRIEAMCSEHNSNLNDFKNGLTKYEINLDHKSLAELAVWEPQTFKSIVKITCSKLKQDGLKLIKSFDQSKNN